jgi:hypothetical protein
MTKAMFQTTLIQISRFGFFEFEIYLVVSLFRISLFGFRIYKSENAS